MDKNVKIMNNANEKNDQVLFCHHDIVLKNDLYYDSLYDFKEICLFCGKEVHESTKSEHTYTVSLSKYSEGLLNGVFSKNSIIDTFREMYLKVVEGEPNITDKEKQDIFVEYIDKTNRQVIRNYRQNKVKKKDFTVINTVS